VVLSAGTPKTWRGSNPIEFGADAVDPMSLLPDRIAKIDIFLVGDRTGAGTDGAADHRAFDR
jgi:hypothetical protein